MFKRLCKALCLLVLMDDSSSHAADFVWRKPGLWEVAIWKEGETSARAVRVQQCTDPKSEPGVLLSIVPGQENCAPMKTVLSSKRREINTQCLVHSVAVKAKVTMNGDFSAAYSGKVRVQYAPASAGVPANTVFEAKWVGPCKSDMLAGDMVLSNGITVNVLKDKQARESEHVAH